jgi:tetratricopeptide (TPR) repeat protein
VAYYNRGVTYGELGNLRQAISDYDRTIEINPKYAMAYYNRGVAHIKLGNRSKAMEDLKTAARFDIENAKNFLKSQGMNW